MAAQTRLQSLHTEGKIILASQAYKAQQIKSIRAAAREYQVNYSTLYKRVHGVIARCDQRPPNCKLTQIEENCLVEWIISIDQRGLPPSPKLVRSMANYILQNHGSSPQATVGNH